jgi:tRNA G10  N-methylase Trm11
LATGRDLPALVQAIAQAQRVAPFPAEAFRIEFLRLAQSNPVHKLEAILAAAEALNAYPNLKQPAHRFLLVAGESGLLFGEILAECDHAYQQHSAKPYSTSASMPARLARALVNLVAPPARSILDPFCGTGSLLLEAQALGLAAYGLDHNPKMVGMTRRNLAHFGYQAQVGRGEAETCSQPADAVVTDLPYGRFSLADPAGLLPTFRRLVTLAPQAVYLAGSDISAQLAEAGYRKIEVLHVRKRAAMSRCVHVARVDAEEDREDAVESISGML